VETLIPQKLPERRCERVSNKKTRTRRRVRHWEKRRKKEERERERERERDNITKLYFPLPRTHAWERGKPFSLPLVSSLC